MKVFVTGATGAIGVALIAKLREQQHEVVVLALNEDRARSILGPAVAIEKGDVLDPQAVFSAVALHRPKAIVHQATALNSNIPLTKFEELFRQTNQLRIKGTENLIAAAEKFGVEKIVAQSFCGWPYAKYGGPVVKETHPFDTALPEQMRATSEALQYLEAAVTSAHLEGVALRYGGFYGPRTSLNSIGLVVEQLRGRKFPQIGAGTGWWSFIHVEDAAAATVEVLNPGVRGIYNIVDDEPAPVSEWLPYLAKMVGAGPPRRVPRWLGSLIAGQHLTLMMNDALAGSNAKAKAELDIAFRYPSWRQGFKATFAKATA